HLLPYFHLAARGIVDDEMAGHAPVVEEAAPIVVAPRMPGLVAHRRGPARKVRARAQSGPAADDGRRERSACRPARAGSTLRAGQHLRDRLRVGLEVLVRIVIDRLAGLRIDALGPGHLADVLRGLEELAVEAVEAVDKAVTCGAHDGLAILAVHPGIDEDVA